MKSDLVFFSYSDSQPTDGGMARNHAFFLEMKKRGSRIYNHTSVGIHYRLFSIIRNIMLLLFLKGTNIFILQTVLLKFIFPFGLFKFPVYRSFVLAVLNHAVKKNNVIIEINDLLYEQGIDLGAGMNKTAAAYQRFIFSHPTLQFVFASKLMGDYAVSHYKLGTKSWQTIINGAPTLNTGTPCHLKVGDPEKIRYIYAGTLNKGRDIEKLIEVFADKSGIDLILIGIDGAWISEFNYRNIHYLGQFDEETALAIASQCDIGIIPYDEKKLYYNICYPTKNSFYIAAGLPILCTPLQETMRVFENYPGTAFFESVKNWDFFLTKTDKSDVMAAKGKVEKIKLELKWDFLFADLHFREMCQEYHLNSNA